MFGAWGDAMYQVTFVGLAAVFVIAVLKILAARAPQGPWTDVIGLV